MHQNIIPTTTASTPATTTAPRIIPTRGSPCCQSHPVEGTTTNQGSCSNQDELGSSGNTTDNFQFFPQWAKKPIYVGTVFVPLRSFAFTQGLQRSMVDDGTSNISVAPMFVCKLHANGTCQYGGDCKFVHVCREVLTEGDLAHLLMTSTTTPKQIGTPPSSSQLPLATPSTTIGTTNPSTQTPVAPPSQGWYAGSKKILPPPQATSTAVASSPSGSISSPPAGQVHPQMHWSPPPQQHLMPGGQRTTTPIEMSQQHFFQQHQSQLQQPQQFQQLYPMQSLLNHPNLVPPQPQQHPMGFPQQQQQVQPQQMVLTQLMPIMHAPAAPAVGATGIQALAPFQATSTPPPPQQHHLPGASQLQVPRHHQATMMIPPSSHPHPISGAAAHTGMSQSMGSVVSQSAVATAVANYHDPLNGIHHPGVFRGTSQDSLCSNPAAGRHPAAMPPSTHSSPPNSVTTVAVPPVVPHQQQQQQQQQQLQHYSRF